MSTSPWHLRFIQLYRRFGFLMTLGTSVAGALIAYVLSTLLIAWFKSNGTIGADTDLVAVTAGLCVTVFTVTQLLFNHLLLGRTFAAFADDIERLGLLDAKRILNFDRIAEHLRGRCVCVYEALGEQYQ